MVVVTLCTFSGSHNESLLQIKKVSGKKVSNSGVKNFLCSWLIFGLQGDGSHNILPSSYYYKDTFFNSLNFVDLFLPYSLLESASSVRRPCLCFTWLDSVKFFFISNHFAIIANDVDLQKKTAWHCFFFMCDGEWQVLNLPRRAS